MLAQAYAHPGVYRTSNMLDRPMNPLNRSFDRTQYFHGRLMTAESRVRAWALLHNFLPYGPRTGKTNPYQSPARQLNDRAYHADWLQNLLISASMQGYRIWGQRLQKSQQASTFCPFFVQRRRLVNPIHRETFVV